MTQTNIEKFDGETDVNISGQVVQISGQTIVASVVVNANVSGQIVYFANNSINNVVKISGETVNIVGTISATSNVSGQVVIAEISGQQVISLVSGQIVISKVSGETIISKISGETLISKISGQIVYLISGKNDAQISGQSIRLTDTTGTGLRVVSTGIIWSNALIVGTVSGSVTQISGQTVISNISGQSVYFISGKNDVQISGQLVAISGSILSNISGQIIYTISGKNDVQISGQIVVSKVSGERVRLTDTDGAGIYSTGNRGYADEDGLGMQTVAVYAFDIGSNQFKRLYVDNRRLLVAISGEPVVVSGQTIIALISGQTVVANVNISGVQVRVSGQTVYFVNDGINNIVKISGQRVTIDSILNIPIVSLQSGTNNVQISGQTVIAKISGETITLSNTSFIANISGQIVYNISGQNTVQMSGQTVIAKISGETVTLSNTSFIANISGQIIYHVSGLNAVQISGQTVIAQISGQSIYFVNDGLNNVVKISGQTISASVVNIPTVSLRSGFNDVQISGQTVISKISGETVTLSNTSFIANISGQIIYHTSGKNDAQISGQSVRLPNDGINNVVQISGQTVNAVISTQTNISGQVVYFASGKNDTQVSGQTVIALISGQTVITSVAATNISGQVIYTTSGKNDVQVSGQAVRLTDFTGNALRIVATGIQWVSALQVGTISGSVTLISGQVVYHISGQNDAQISGQTVISKTSGERTRLTDTDGAGVYSTGTRGYSDEDGLGMLTMAGYAYDPLGATWRKLYTEISGGHKLLVSVSGDPVRISGQLVIAKISGETVAISNAAFIANVSGQVIYHTSGKNDVQISGQTVIALISGQTVVTSVNVTTNISGQVIYHTSGKNDVQVSGQTVVSKVSGELVRNADGAGNLFSSTAIGSQNAIVVMISGQPVTSSVNVTTNISGQIVYIVSGQNAVQNSGQTIRIANDSINNVVKTSGQTEIAQISGQTVIALISGQTVVASVTSNISGQVVYLTSGKNDVQISGQTVIAKASGERVRITDTDGAGIYSTGTRGQSDEDGLGMQTFGGYAYDVQGATWRKLVVDISGGHALVVNVSGQQVRVSGQVVIANISGQAVRITDDGLNNVVKISGQTVNISGQIISISGQLITVSGQTIRTSGQVAYFVNDGINNVVKMSGQVVVAKISGEIVYLTSGKADINVVDVGGIVDTLNTTTVPLASGATFTGGTNDTLTDVYMNVNVWADKPSAVDGLQLQFSSDATNWDHISKYTVSGRTSGATGVVNVTLGSRARYSRVVYINGGGPQGTSGFRLQTVRKPAAGPVGINRVVDTIYSETAGQTMRAVMYAQGDIGTLDNIQMISGAVYVSVVSGLNTVQISGQVVIAKVSGEAIRLTNDSINNVVKTSGQTEIAQVSGQAIRFTDDGLNNVVKISGQTVTVSNLASTDVSGSTVWLASGKNAVQVSGQTVYFVNNSIDNVVKISGQTITFTNTTITFTNTSIIAKVSGEVVRLGDGAGNILDTTTIGSQNALVVMVSGQVVNISGQTTVSKISGESIRLTDFTGNAIRSVGTGVVWTGAMQVGTISGSVTLISGQTVDVVPAGMATIRTGGTVTCASLSGGTALTTSTVQRAVVRALTNISGVMWVGSTTNPPFSGGGFLLEAGDALTFEPTNLNQIKVFATVSGDKVCWIGQDAG